MAAAALLVGCAIHRCQHLLHRCLSATDRFRHSQLLSLQELAEGKTLGDVVASGWTPSETDVQCIAEQLLRTIQYLQSKRIVHGDIK